MVFGEPFYYGGQEAFALNLFEYINHEKFKIDFYTPYGFNNKKAKDLIDIHKSNIFFDNYEFNTKLRKKYFINGFKKFMKNNKNKYDIVHINSGSTFILVNAAKITKKFGVKKVIIHSHASGVFSLKHNITNKIQEPLFKYADVFLSCSHSSAEYRFPTNIVKNKKYEVIFNGIDLKKFKYDETIRNIYRKELNLKKDDILLCNVGRFSFEKNQLFILDILNKLNNTEKFYKLLLVGDGPDEEKIKNKILEYNLSDKVIILNKRSDINNLLMASDLFVFPSLYEGLGIAAIEAIASGLPVVISNNVPINEKLFENVYKIKEFDVNCWFDFLCNMNLKRNLYSINKLKSNGFDIIDTVNKMEKLYFNI